MPQVSIEHGPRKPGAHRPRGAGTRAGGWFTDQGAGHAGPWGRGTQAKGRGIRRGAHRPRGQGIRGCVCTHRPRRQGIKGGYTQTKGPGTQVRVDGAHRPIAHILREWSTG